MRSHLALTLFLAACGGTSNEPFAFEEGTYDVDFEDVDTTSCGFEAVALRTDTMQVGVTETLDGMRYSYPDATSDQASVDCTLDGADFDCDALTADQDLTRYDYDAIVTLALSQSGRWTEPDAHEGGFTYAFSCEGADCGAGALAGSVYGQDAIFPCDVSGSYTGQKAD